MDSQKSPPSTSSMISLTSSSIAEHKSKPNQSDTDATDDTQKNKTKQMTPNKQENGFKKQRKPKSKTQNPADRSSEIFQIMRQNVTEGLTHCESGQELEILQNALRPDFNLLWLKCMEVKRDLVAALCRVYPGVRLEVFGSTVMGIAFKDSDFDFYVELSREKLNMSSVKLNGKAMHYLGRTGKFSNFTPISHARVPILKCYHVPTGYQCDINFSDSYGILNSPIVARLLQFDARIYVLATIIKYWTKLHDCAGKERISNYAIIWMLLFYLQQLPEPIVPPITEFQKRVAPYFVNNFFNFAFDTSYPNQTRNKMRCSELLLGFFKFYKDFDFKNNIICPINGKAFPKADIIEKKLPEFQRYHEILVSNQLQPMSMNKCICIQDPFEITHSIPGVIAVLQFQKIILKFQLAAETIETELAEDGESTKLLLLLFDVEKFEAFAVERTKKQRQIDQMNKHQRLPMPKVTTANNKTSICLEPTDHQLSITRDILVKKFNDADVKIDKVTINRLWAETVIEFLVEILRDLFMFDIGYKSVESSDKFLRQFEVSGTRDVFVGRRQRRSIHPGTWHIEKSESRKRFDSACKIALKINGKITADLENLDKVTIEFEDNIKTKKNNSYKSFMTTFAQNINHFMKICFVGKNGAGFKKATELPNTADQTNGESINQPTDKDVSPVNGERL